LLTHRRRAEQALITVVATAYLLGVSTRRVEKLAEQLGIKSLSRSQVSEMATHLDAQVTAFRERPLDAGPYTFCWVDALTVKVREDGRVVNVHALIASGVNADGHREILGLDVTSGEDGAGWLAFLRGLVARGLSGVQLVISDAHPGIGRRDRRGATGRVLAALSYPLPAQLAHPRAQERAAARGHPRCARSSTKLTTTPWTRSSTGSSMRSRASTRTRPRIWRALVTNCRPSPATRMRSGARSGRTIPRNG
jgi:Transposase, Mutator family